MSETTSRHHNTGKLTILSLPCWLAIFGPAENQSVWSFSSWTCEYLNLKSHRCNSLARVKKKKWQKRVEGQQSSFLQQPAWEWPHHSTSHLSPAQSSSTVTLQSILTEPAHWFLNPPGTVNNMECHCFNSYVEQEQTLWALLGAFVTLWRLIFWCSANSTLNIY